MIRTKYKLFLLFLCAAFLFAGVAIFAACGGSETYTVTFMVRESGDAGEWATYQSVRTNSDGSVAFPASPVIEGYLFRDWYTDPDFAETSRFDGVKINGDLTVYAKMVEATVTLSVTKGDGSVVETADFKLKDLSEKTEEYGADANAADLTFDGWYTSENFDQDYRIGMDATNLYGRYMAKVTFDNGYDTLEKLVVPEGQLTQPSLNEIKKDYMSAEDIYYMYADTKSYVTFPATVSVNTNITVQWKTEGLRFETNSRTGHLTCVGLNTNNVGDYRNLQVISVPYKVGNNVVDAVSSLSVDSGNAPAVKKVIFQEGIKCVADLRGGNTSGVDSVVLPDSLRILENSFNGFPNLNADSFRIPQNTEIIIGSFFARESMQVGIGDSGAYDFEIEVPDSVVNLSNVPANLVFGAGSVFAKDGENRIYTESDSRGKLLIVDYNIVNGAITVPEGYVGIQVGAFFGVPDLKYLTLPSTWNYVAYNVSYESKDGDGTERTYYLRNTASRSSNLSGPDMSNPLNDFAVGAYSIVSTLQQIDRVRIQQNSYPSGVEIFALVGNTAGALESPSYQPYLAAQYRNKVFFMEDLDPGTSVTVSVAATNGQTGETVNTAIYGVVSGDTLTQAQITDAIGAALGVNFSDVYALVSVRESGVDIGDGYFVTRNLDITAAYEYRALGIVTADDGSGGLTVTAYDADSAYATGDEIIVSIPDEIDGKKITSIAADAFAGTNITAVYIGQNVAEIGNRAFMNTESLQSVVITPGGLSVIGRSAFENSGFAEIALPIANLTDVQPYAFKSDKLKKFVGVESEKLFQGYIERALVLMNDYLISEFDAGNNYFSSWLTGVGVGDYFFVADLSGNYIGLARYAADGGTEKQCKSSDTENKTVDVHVYDVQLIAVAGGADISSLSLGHSSRGVYFGLETGYVCRFEVMEGSVYYLNGLTELNFGYVSRIHEGAFTDMKDGLNVTVLAGSYNAPGKYASDCYDEWMTLESVTSMDEEIFEDGWWNGVRKADADYAEKTEFVANANKSAAVNVVMMSH